MEGLLKTDIPSKLSGSRQNLPWIKGECSVLKKKKIMDENDALSEYNKILLGHSRTNGAVYSKIYFKGEICSAH